MEICINVQSAITQRAGVGRYTRLLAEELGRTAGSDTLKLFYFDFKRKGVPFEAPNSLHKAIRWCPGRAAQLAWKTINFPPFEMFAGKSDVYHFPNFILPPLTVGKSVVTIHDMSFLRYPEFAEEKNRSYLTKKIRDTVKRADAIITDSNFSAGEIHELLGVSEDRIFPIHLGISEDFKRPDDDRIKRTMSSYGITKPYILTVGTLEPRKNIPFLIDVFENLSSFDGELVIAGMPGWKYEPIMERILSSKRANDIRYIKYVSDDDLSSLYAGAELFACTSLYEGFGFPPLESLACGTPVISSAGGSLKEVLAPDIAVIDSFDSDEWKTEIESLLSNKEKARSQVEAGKKLLTNYTWKKTADETWKVYRSI